MSDYKGYDELNKKQQKLVDYINNIGAGSLELIEDCCNDSYREYMEDSVIHNGELHFNDHCAEEINDIIDELGTGMNRELLIDIVLRSSETQLAGIRNVNNGIACAVIGEFERQDEHIADLAKGLSKKQLKQCVEHITECYWDPNGCMDLVYVDHHHDVFWLVCDPDILKEELRCHMLVTSLNKLELGPIR